MSAYLFKLNRYNQCDVNSIHKRIQNTVRVSESEYIMNKASLSVQHNSRDANNLNWNTQSDRLLKSNTLKNISQVPSHGNSLKTTKTSLRPGALRPAGYGVDIKHNSYDLYLARIKGKTALKQETNFSQVPSKAVVNNKPRKLNIVSGSTCSC